MGHGGNVQQVSAHPGAVVRSRVSAGASNLQVPCGGCRRSR